MGLSLPGWKLKMLSNKAWKSDLGLAYRMGISFWKEKYKTGNVKG